MPLAKEIFLASTLLSPASAYSLGTSVTTARPVQARAADVRLNAEPYGTNPPPPSNTRRLFLAATTTAAAGTYAGRTMMTVPGQEQFQELSRMSVVDPRAEQSMLNYFPGSLGSVTMDRIIWDVLSKRGYTNANTLMATSVCPDEVNAQPGELVELLKNRWGENFALGGLGGVPFTGKAGLSAYAHHVPDDGKMLIVFAPHVGVEYDGKVGALQRVNQADVSSACGAALGAYKAIMKQAAAAPPPAGDGQVVSDYFDAQINFIVAKLRSRLANVKEAPEAITYVTYQMYCLIRNFLSDEALAASGIWDYAKELTFVGGIMVNRAIGGDRFMPLMFQSRKAAPGTAVDLYEEAFGKPPNLQSAVGSALSNDEIFKYDIEKMSDGK